MNEGIGLKYLCLLICLMAILGFKTIEQAKPSSIAGPEYIMNIPGYPLIFELNKGEHIEIYLEGEKHQLTRTIKLLSVKTFKDSNLWFPDSLGKSSYYKAEIQLEISGEPVTILHRPYQMPINFNGLRIYVEAVKEWNESSLLEKIKNLNKDVRLSVCLEGEPWGKQEEMTFPIQEYRYRAAVYNNTWSSLVPYNKLYYHRGEDYGLIPEKLDVIAFMKGNIVQAPPSSDRLFKVLTPDGIAYRYAHMNLRTFDKMMMENKTIKKGQFVGLTGDTGNGPDDPHLHFDLMYKDTYISSYPYVIESYFRKYDDQLIAIAGGYRFLLTGNAIELDASRSIARRGEEIESYTWKLHDGSEVEKQKIWVKYTSPGLYSEELIVKTKSGAIDKDFLQVRVYGNEGLNIARGWAYYDPIRNIHTETPVLFQYGLSNMVGKVMIDFGDGTPIRVFEKERIHAWQNTGRISHTFSKPGNYTVHISGNGPENEPASVKLEVIVEE